MSFEDRSQSYLENGYALGRGYSSSLRLNLQHHLLRELLGYSIHPDILANVDTESHLQIADVGTGTGQWLIDVARELPSAQLDGFDISTDQYPSSAWLPSNILLRQLDIMESIPGNMEGKYDIVHVQLFLCVIQKDPIAVLKELLKMLSKPMSEVLHSSTKWPAALPNHLYLANHVLMAEPGGYLQWVEYDPTTFEVVSPIPSLAQGANEQHVQIIRGPQGLATKWPSELQIHFNNVGFTQVKSIPYPLPPTLYAPFMQCHLCAAEEVSFKVMKNDGPDAQGPAFRKLLAEVYNECQSGVTMAESPIVVYGQRSLV